MICVVMVLLSDGVISLRKVSDICVVGELVLCSCVVSCLNGLV